MRHKGYILKLTGSDYYLRNLGLSNKEKNEFYNDLYSELLSRIVSDIPENQNSDNYYELIKDKVVMIKKDGKRFIISMDDNIPFHEMYDLMSRNVDTIILFRSPTTIRNYELESIASEYNYASISQQIPKITSLPGDPINHPEIPSTTPNNHEPQTVRRVADVSNFSLKKYSKEEKQKFLKLAGKRLLKILYDIVIGCIVAGCPLFKEIIK